MLFPTDPFTILRPRNPPIGVSELRKVCRSTDLKALKLWKVRSGCYLIPATYGSSYLFCSIQFEGRQEKGWGSQEFLWQHASYLLHLQKKTQNWKIPLTEKKIKVQGKENVKWSPKYIQAPKEEINGKAWIANNLMHSPSSEILALVKWFSSIMLINRRSRNT